jgi:SHS2 domain-containing protein
MPYAYLDDIAMADLALRAWGQTLEETFLAAAEATTHAMVEDLATIAPQQQRTFEVHEA